jgi:ATP-dependent DNA helicase RecG
MATGQLDSPIAYLKGVGPQKAEILQKELGIFRFGDLLAFFPFRYIDRSQIDRVADCVHNGKQVQLRGFISGVELIPGKGNKQRLRAWFSDGSGRIELVWFSGIKWVQNVLHPNMEYLLFGRLNVFNGNISIPHPELEGLVPGKEINTGLEPVYSSTEKAKQKGVHSRFIRGIIRNLWEQYQGTIGENLPPWLVEKLGFPDRDTAIRHIHLPPDRKAMEMARYRLKFEELFFAQVRLMQSRTSRKSANQGLYFSNLEPEGIFNRFYSNHLPFSLTNAQKRVLKEIRRDFLSGQQMNRLLQGDVGSGKTMVAFLSILMALESGFQTCLLAPTEILANQHFQGLKPFAEALGIGMELLTGSTRKKKRAEIDAALQAGSLHVLIGTHAVLEEHVQFASLGLSVIDEQHRFGVAQRARLWEKGGENPPHILVMTATPIPRTLAMTVYGDLDVSTIDELPPGRKPVQTIHRREGARDWAYQFIRTELQKGRQAYIVYPLIEGSEKLDYRDLTEGFEWVKTALSEFNSGMLHGQMKADEKDAAMQKFLSGETKILVSTTVIEVGVNVPNASVMLIESAERFGLSQLHQLRGRVGRGAEQSFCILLTGNKLSEEGLTRMQTMCETNDGFRIAEVDLKLRGPGDLEGTRQSGDMSFRIADLATDQHILIMARGMASELVDKDPQMELPEHAAAKKYMEVRARSISNWSQIS